MKRSPQRKGGRRSIRTDFDPVSSVIATDPEVAAERRFARARRIHTVQVPVLRAVGVALLALLVFMHQRFVDGVTGVQDSMLFLQISSVYVCGSWLLLLFFYKPQRRFDLSLLFLVLDVPIWTLSVYLTGANTSLWFFVSLMRVADQVSTTFKRVVFFSFFSPLSYALLIGYVQVFEHKAVDWPVEAIKIGGMLAIGLYVSMTARAAEGVRQRMLEYLRVAKESYRELKQYSEALNTSRKANELKNRTLVKQAGALLSKNKALEEANEKTEAARLQAVIADRAKGEFLANMSHEIRTPMNAVLGFADLVLQTDLEDDQREQLEEVQESGRNLLTLIDDVLDLSKLDSGKLEPEEVAFSPADHFRKLAGTKKTSFANGKVDFEVVVAPDVPPVVASDPGRIRQIVANLLDNAAKFTDEGHVRMRLGVKRLPGGDVGLTYEVSDTGIGIPPDHQERIFDLFSQADTSVTRRFGGAGLGLTIARALVDLLHGTIVIESEVERGTSVLVTLPVKVVRATSFERLAPQRQGESYLEPTAPADIQTPGYPRMIDLDAMARKASSADRAQTTEPVEGSAEPATARSILIVEDNPVNQKLVSRILDRAGYRVEVAANGREALDRLADDAFDLVLMDMQMPVLDGYEATRAIKGDTKWHAMPVIALTAHAMRGDREKCLEAGCDDYLTKPVKRDILLHAVERHLKPS